MSAQTFTVQSSELELLIAAYEAQGNLAGADALRTLAAENGIRLNRRTLAGHVQTQRKSYEQSLIDALWG